MNKKIFISHSIQGQTYICTGNVFYVGSLYFSIKVVILMGKRINELSRLIERHMVCDWGDVDIEIKINNDEFSRLKKKVKSSYNTDVGVINIVTDIQLNETYVYLSCAK